MRSISTLLLLAILTGGVWAEDKKKDPGQIGNRDVGKGVNFYSLEKEIALGRQMAQEVQREAKINDDPILSEYVNRVGQNLVRNSDAKVPFSFKVIEADDLNAFALPGGYVFVNTGLIVMAEEEDEFAGVAARQAAGLAIPMTFLSFSRKDESEADYLGLQYMYAAGYDPNGAISIFEKLEALSRRKPGAVSRLFSTHPMDGDRIRNEEKEIQEILPGRKEYVVSNSEYHDVRARLLKLASRRKPEEPDNRPRLIKPLTPHEN